MAAIPFDPFRTQARFAWRNRWARLRRDRVQAAVHAAALFALALLLGVPAWNARAGWGGAVADLLRQWPTAVWLVAVSVMASSFAARWRALHAAARHDWLAALPVAASRRRRRVQDALLLQAAGFAAIGSVLLLAAHAGALHFATFLFAIATALSLAWPLAWWRERRVAVAGAGDASSRAADRSGGTAGALVDSALQVRDAAAATDLRPVPSMRARETWSSVVADRGTGRLWRWQRLACGVALHGRTLAWGALAWLTVPMGGGFGAALVAGVAGISLAWLAGAWRRCLAVIPQAQRWLATQPMRPAQLLRAASGVPAVVLALAIAAVAGVPLALGVPALAAFAALALFAFGALQFAATAAERRRPARIALAFLVHAALLVGVLQAFPIAALPLWMVQMIMLLRRALR
jgi:hypothetical protein